MKLKLRLLCVGIFLGSFLQQTIAQNITVAGKVKSKTTSEALMRATVSIKGTSTSTSTDESGNFQISIPKGGSLVVTSIGFLSSTYVVKKQGDVLILMEDGNKQMEEVIVIGYGTQKVTKVSGAISTIKTDAIEKASPVRVEDAIQGRASGVTIVQSGSPGVKPTLFVRGIPSYNGSDPLVVVDGSIQTLDDLNAINPSDVESINILKDAAATAIYGVSGGNGVIVLTTKSGKKNQKTQFSISSSAGLQKVANNIPVLNATEYAAMLNEGSTTSGDGIIFPDISKLGVGTNWQDQIFKSAPIQSHSISASGGSDKMTYFLSGGYNDQAGILGGIDKSNFGRTNFTANLNFQLTPKLKFVVNATEVLLSSKGVKEGTWNGIIGEALNFDPTVSVYNTVPGTIGNYGYSTLIKKEVHNPLTDLQNTYNQNNGNKQYGKFEFQYDALKNLKVTSRFGYTNYIDNVKTFNPLVFYGINNDDNSLDETGSATIKGILHHNSVSSLRNNYFTWNWETFANYNFDINKDHHFETTAGIAFGQSSQNHLGASRQDVPFNSWTYASLQAATGINSSTNTTANSGYYYGSYSRNVSFFARANYDYQNKYLLSASIRRDGYSEFQPAKKYGNFYAGSVGWVVSKEDFFRSTFINFLKIRASYGSVGSNAGASLQTTTIATGGTYNNIGNNNGYFFNGAFYPGSSIGGQGNPLLLGWETDAQTNAGFDMTFFKNKFTINADYFQKNVSNLIFTGAQALYVGTVPAPFSNVGTTKTTGLDVTLGYNDRIGKKLGINTSLNFTAFKSLVIATSYDGTAKIAGGYYFNGQSQSVTVFEKGQTPGYFYGYKTAGLFQTADEVAKSPLQAGAQPGDIKYADVNGDGVINSKDQTKIGNPFPKFVLGWNIGLDFMNFDFTVFTYVSYGNDIYRAYERNANFTNKFSGVLNRWTGPNTTTDARYPRYTFTDANNNARVSDRFVEDGSFIKIKNLQLGYTFPKTILKGMFSKIRWYIAVKNAFTFTKYSGYDPEISGGILGSGVDLGTYPLPRTFLTGLDLRF